MHHLIHGLHWKTSWSGHTHWGKEMANSSWDAWEDPWEVGTQGPCAERSLGFQHDQWCAWLDCMAGTNGSGHAPAEKWMLHFLCDLWLEFSRRWNWIRAVQRTGTKDMWNCYRVRDNIPTPHCFIMLKGKHLPHKYAVLLDSVEAEASYCCVKAFVRDTALQQPPVYFSPAGRHTSVLTSQPRELIAKKEMSEDEIKSYLKLANLCKTKYEMPDAHDALWKFVRERHYEAAGMLGWQGHKTQPMELYILCNTQLPTFTFHICQTDLGDVCQGFLKHLPGMMPTFTPVSGVSGMSGVFVSSHLANDWGYGKRCSTWQFNANVFVFSSALLVALPQHACCYWWLLRGAPINCKELL